MTFPKLAAMAMIAMTCAAPSFADSTLNVTDLRAFETAPTAMAAGGFLTITNTGTTDDALIGVIADFPRVALHTTEFEGDIARMVHVDRVPVPAGATVTLKPGGLHVMFMGVRDNPLTAGDSLPATLVFEQAGEVAVTFAIIARDAAMPMGHGSATHNH